MLEVLLSLYTSQFHSKSLILFKIQLEQGDIMSPKVNLIHIYGPNEDTPSFFEKLLLTVSTLEGLYILGGGFNCTLDPVMDRLTGTDASHVQTRKNWLNSLKT